MTNKSQVSVDGEECMGLNAGSESQLGVLPRTCSLGPIVATTDADSK